MNYKVNSYFLDLRVGITFSILIYLIVSFYNDGSVNYNIPKYLAGFSYTLYLTHYPLANFILTWRLSPYYPFEGTPLLIKLVLSGLVFGYAWVIGLLTERNTDEVRKYILIIVFKQKTRMIHGKKFSVNID